MNTFSILLLYPDYLSDNYGQETFFTSVKAKDYEDAILAAQYEAIDSNPDCDDPEDFHPLLALDGEHHSYI